MAALAAFALTAKEKNLEFGVGEQGPEVRVRGTEEIDQLLGLANLVFVNNAELPSRLRWLTSL